MICCSGHFSRERWEGSAQGAKGFRFVCEVRRWCLSFSEYNFWLHNDSNFSSKSDWNVGQPSTVYDFHCLFVLPIILVHKVELNSSYWTRKCFHSPSKVDRFHFTVTKRSKSPGKSFPANTLHFTQARFTVTFQQHCKLCRVKVFPLNCRLLLHTWKMKKSVNCMFLALNALLLLHVQSAICQNPLRIWK